MTSKKVDFKILADDETDQGKLQRAIAATLPEPNKNLLVCQTIPALLEGAKFHKGIVSIDNRYILSGAAGSRARRIVSLEHNESRKIVWDYMSATTRTQKGTPIRTIKSAPPQNIPVCLDCRNLTNYYHFVSETLASIASLCEIIQKRDIYIHVPSLQGKDGFAARLIEDFFPSLRERIHFISDKDEISYDKCIFPFATDHLFYTLDEDYWSAEEKDVLSALDGFNRHGADTHLNRQRYRKVNESLFQLRRMVLSQTGEDTAGSESKRIIIGRKSSRVRTDNSWEVLRERLLGIGFNEIFLEDLRPRDQAAAMQNADIVVASHGAGITNMLFASENTKFIELGNISSTGGRLAAFYELSQVSGCNYSLAYCDRGTVDGKRLDGNALSPISLSDAAISAIIDEIEEHSTGK